MPRPITPFELMNPWSLARFTWHQGRRGWSRLWQAPGPNARFFLATSYLWTIPAALTDPFKALYLSSLGLSNLAIGGFFALDMGLRIFGVLAGGLVAQRWGHKRTLLVSDFFSWVIPSVTLALATEPWHVYLATCLTSTNALVAGSVTQMLVEDSDDTRRGQVFALAALTAVIPLLLLPPLAGWGVARWGVVPAMRLLYGAMAVMTLGGILWRRVSMQESAAVSHGADLSQLLKEAGEVAAGLVRAPALGAVLGSWVLVNVVANLNRAYYALYITQQLGLKAAWMGGLTAASSAAFVAASLGWVPRLKAHHERGAFVWLSAANALPALGLLLAWGPAWVAALYCLSGLLAAPHNALMSGRLAALFPKDKEGMAQSLLSSVMQAAVALSLALAGALFLTRFSAFPVLLAALALAQAGLAWRLVKKESVPQ